MSSSCSFSIRNIILLISTTILFAGESFPDFETQASLISDLKTAALIANLPPVNGADHYLGFRAALGILNTTSNGSYAVPGVRMSIYPNPGYNMWFQIAKWSDDSPGFSVGTGLQMQFPGDNLNTNRAIGLGWNKVYGNAYTQRDIKVHALYSRSYKTVDVGAMALMDLHHILIDDEQAIPDYNKSINQIVPFVSWMVMDLTKCSLSLPFDSKTLAIDFNCEIRFGKRD
ncbi:hypothetical protein HQ531_12870 [bacterium]|nr:hypothetical protein [bacterium]